MAAECLLFWNILKKDAELKWSEDHKKAIERINNQVKKEEVPHFKKNGPLRIICDASKQGLGAILQQNEEHN